MWNCLQSGAHSPLVSQVCASSFVDLSACPGRLLHGGGPSLFALLSVTVVTLPLVSLLTSSCVAVLIVRFAVRVRALKKRYARKTYVKGIAASPGFITAMKDKFLPYEAVQSAMRGRRSPTECVEAVGLRLAIDQLQAWAKENHAVPAQHQSNIPRRILGAEHRVPPIHGAAWRSRAELNLSTAGNPSSSELLTTLVSPPPLAMPDPLSTAKRKQPVSSRTTSVAFRFAPSVEVDGTFACTTDEWRIESLYVIRLPGDPATATEGELSICENRARVRVALQSPIEQLDPACDYSALPSMNATRIQVLAEGAVTRASAEALWKIRRKIQVSFL